MWFLFFLSFFNFKERKGVLNVGKGEIQGKALWGKREKERLIESGEGKKGEERRERERRTCGSSKSREGEDFWKRWYLFR